MSTTLVTTVTQDPASILPEAPAAVSSAPAVPGVAAKTFGGLRSFIGYVPAVFQYTYAGLTSGYEKSMSLYVAAAAQGHPGAQFALAQNSEKMGDLEEAFKYYQQAADLGHIEAQCKVGECYEIGKGIGKDLISASTYYLKAADLGNVEAMFKLGGFYELLLGDGVNPIKALEYYKKAAAHYHADAQFKVAQFYDQGIGVEKNPVEAFNFYHKAALQKHIEASFKTAECYELGIGTGAFPKSAFKHYQFAAEEGHARAQHKVGDFHLNGIYVNANPSEALKAYEKAAALGNPASKDLLLQLQSCLDQNNIPEGVNANLAFVYFLNRANQGDAAAQFAAARCYDKGEGTPIDDRQAAIFCGKAAGQRHAQANLCLAHLYENGKGVKKSREKASLCYQKALVFGLEEPHQAEATAKLTALVGEIELEIQNDLT